MRIYKDAKMMAKSLRMSLADRRIPLSHSECLEIVAKQFGFADWNTLSAKGTPQQTMLDEARQGFPTAAPEQLFCSFCGKSQDEVRSLVEGGCSNRGISPCVFICDECVAVSAQVNADILGDAEGAPKR